MKNEATIQDFAKLVIVGGIVYFIVAKMILKKLDGQGVIVAGVRG